MSPTQHDNAETAEDGAAAAAPPPATTPARSDPPGLMRSWPLIALCTLALAGAGVVVGLTREEEFTAEQQLSVGNIEVQAQAIPGFVEASRTLASSYARLGTTDDVLRRVSAETGLSLEAIEDNLEYAPIPDSPVLRVEATASTEAGAIQLARAGSDALLEEVEEQSSVGRRADRMLTIYRERVRAADRARRRLEALRAQQRENPSAELTERVEAAKVAAETSRLSANTLAELYGQARLAEQRGAGIQALRTAREAESDRSSTLQQLGFAGGVAGLVLGIGLAALLAQRRRRPTAA